MSLATSLAMLAAAAAPTAQQATGAPPPTAPAAAAQHRVVASASARVVILRPAIISFTPSGGAPQSDAITRQTARRGTRVSVEFY